MSAIWTHSQQRAIDIRSTNTLISAAAGSGKTAVLVQRVIKLITDSENPVQIDKLLIATFTNAAASEMRDRIQTSLTKQLEFEPENRWLQKQLTLLGKASITTVHAFCQNLIRNNFHKLGLSANFEIGDETTLNILRNKALDELLEKYYDDISEEFELLVGGFGGKRDDSMLTELILNLFRFSQSTENPLQWLKNTCEKFNFDESCDENIYITNMWGNELLSKIKLELMGIVRAYDDAIELIECDEGLEKYIETFYAEREMIFDFAKKCNKTWDEVCKYILNISFATLPRKSKTADDVIAKQVQLIRNNAKKQIGKLYEVFYANSSDICSDNKILYGVVNTLCSLVIEFNEIYSQKKRDKNILDFNDLEHFAIKLLVEYEDTQNELKEKFDEVLVDEYQDTNGVQARLFELLSRGNNTFMVGDIKQSIYGFRNAQPKIFIDKFNKYSKEGNELGTKIILSKNFRSSRGIIDFANYLFETIMSAEVGDVVFSNDERLEFGNINMQSDINGVEVHLIEKKIEEDDNLSDDDIQKDEITREAMFVAQRIIQLVEVEKPLIFDKAINDRRPLAYRDIAILSRKTTGVSNVFAEQLAQMAIPVYCEQTGGYFMSIEIATMIAFLQIIDNPLHDIALLTVLRSPMFMFDENELAKIRGLDKKCSFYNAILQSNDDKCINFINVLQKYIEFASIYTIENLIREIMNDTGYYFFVGALPNGKVRMNNLRLLCQRASNFEANEHKSIFEFIQYINAMTQGNQEYSSAKIISENDNVVTIMSIHKSKGLEFPAVFLIRCGSRFNKTDLISKVLYDLDMGIGIDFVDVNRNIKYPTISKLAIAQKKKYQILSEEMRILYVALTRPKEMLFIVGSTSGVEEKQIKWQNTVSSPYEVSQQNSYLDWIGMAIANKNIIVTHSANELLRVQNLQIKQQYKNVETNNIDLMHEIDRRLTYSYKYLNAKYIPTKMSVSEAIGSSSHETKLKSATFLSQQSKMSNAIKGTIIHFVLQNIDLKKCNNYSEIENQLNSMVQSEVLTNEQFNIIDIHSIADFFASDLGKRMLNSNNVGREVKFFIDINANEIIEGLDENVANEKILLQGVIDCYFEEDNEIVIIDYKTGKMQDEYKKQLEFYAKGLCRILGKNVKETHIYPLIGV